jgi:hypothetical protein
MEGSALMGNKLRTSIILVVAAVWAANFLAPIFEGGYQPSPELNVAFMAIVGVLTASYRKNDKDGDGKG